MDFKKIEGLKSWRGVFGILFIFYLILRAVIGFVADILTISDKLNINKEIIFDKITLFWVFIDSPFGTFLIITIGFLLLRSAILRPPQKDMAQVKKIQGKSESQRLSYVKELLNSRANLYYDWAHGKRTFNLQEPIDTRNEVGNFIKSALGESAKRDFMKCHGSNATEPYFNMNQTDTTMRIYYYYLRELSNKIQESNLKADFKIPK